MYKSAIIEELAQRAAARRIAVRRGRSFQGEAARRRELAAAGATHQTHGSTLNYPAGAKLNRTAPETTNKSENTGTQSD